MDFLKDYFFLMRSTISLKLFGEITQKKQLKDDIIDLVSYIQDGLNWYAK